MVYLYCHCVMSFKDLVLPSNGKLKMKFMDPIRCSDINKSHICPNNKLGSKVVLVFFSFNHHGMNEWNSNWSINKCWHLNDEHLTMTYDNSLILIWTNPLPNQSVGRPMRTWENKTSYHP